MKIIKYIIYILLLISIWTILSVGLTIIPTFEADITKETADRVNSVMINISYSYLAGYIMYFLTVSLPTYRRKMTMEPLINDYIETYCSQSLFSFFMYYNNSDLLEFDIKEHQNVKEIVIEHKKDEKMIDTITKSNTFQSRKEILSRFNHESNLFFNKIIPYEELLAQSQQEIINDIRKDNFITLFDYYDKTTEDVKDIKMIFYDRFDTHIKLIYKLRKTI